MTAPLTIPLGPSLTAEQAEAIYAQGKEAVIFALLEMAKQLSQPPQTAATTASIPSGMIPVHEKPTTKARRKKSGRKPGHPPARRPTPERVDHHQEHRADCCPDCGGSLTRRNSTRTRFIEDIPQVQPEVTGHTIHRDWCSRCQKHVEPVVPDALPNSTLGHNVLVLSAWLHYALGNTLSQIVDVFNFHLQLKISTGGLLQMWYRLQEILFAWYEQIQQQALGSAVLHGDETGWRVNGKTHWLWCFSNDTLTYFMIDRSRGSPALAKFFIQEFDGTLVSDFWGAYNAVDCSLRQTCLVHLLRDLENVDKYKDPSEHWPAFAKKLRRWIADAIRLWRRQENYDEATYASRQQRLHDRLAWMIANPWEDAQAQRLIKRLRRHQKDLLTFLDQQGVPFENNHAERAIRPAVILRKNSYGNRSERGADAQAVLMSIFRTLKQRGLDPIPTMRQALETCLKTGMLPPLPAPNCTDR
jgi:transposase